VDIILVSGARARKGVQVQVLFPAPRLSGISLKVFLVNVAKNVAMLFAFTAMLLVE